MEKMWKKGNPFNTFVILMSISAAIMDIPQKIKSVTTSSNNPVTGSVSYLPSLV